MRVAIEIKCDQIKERCPLNRGTYKSNMITQEASPCSGTWGDNNNNG